MFTRTPLSVLCLLTPRSLLYVVVRGNKEDRVLGIYFRRAATLLDHSKWVYKPFLATIDKICVTGSKGTLAVWIQH